MTDQPTREHLQKLLDGELDEVQQQRLARLIENDPALQRLLDQMTANDTHLPPADENLDPALRQLIDQLRGTDPNALLQSAGDDVEADDAISFPDPPTDSAPLGRLGHYDIVRSLGRGSTGLLFEARDTQLDRTVAIKVLRRDLASLASARARFDREARAAASLLHDHIVTIHDVGFHPGFPPFLVMEFIGGRSLRDNMRRQTALGPGEAARIARQVALGLQAAHDRGLVHRDIKPSNIMLDETTGRARITDFGLARAPRTGSDITREGSIAGTPAYMSPEQIATPQSIDHRSDIYSLGAVLYEMLTGERPFHGVTRMVLLQVLHDEPRAPRRLNDRIPRDLDTITLKCLDKDPGRRYQSAAALAEELQRWIDGQPVRARPISTTGRTWRWCKRNPAMAALSALAILLLLVVSAGSIIANVLINQQKQQEADARQIAEINARMFQLQQKAATNAKKTADHSARAAARQRDLAIDTLNKLVFEVHDELDDNSAGTVRLKKQLLDIAMEGLQQVTRDDSSGGAAEATQINALWRRGDTFILMGRTAAARQQYERALEIAAAAANRRENDVDVLRDLEMAHDKLAEVADAQGNSQMVLDHSLKSLAIASRVAALAEDDPSARQDLIFSLVAVADAYIALGDMKQARAHADAAAEAIDLNDAAPTDPDQRQLLAISCEQVGQLFSDLGDDKKAQQFLRVSRELLDEADTDAMSDTYTQLGSVTMALNDPQAAQRFYEQAVREAEQLLAENPHSLMAQKALFDTHTEIGDALFLDMNDAQTAVAHYQKALAIAKPIAQADENNTESQRMLAMAHGQLGDALLMLDKKHEALSQYEQALTIARALAGNDPSNAASRQALSTAWEQLVEAHLALEQFGEARRAAQQSIDIDTALLKANSADVTAAIDLSIAYEKMALVEEMAGNKPEAANWFDKSAQIMERLSRDEKLTAADRFDVLVTRMKQLANHGDATALLAAGDQLRALGPDDPEVLYNLACCHALAAELVTPTERKVQIEKALAALQAAVDHGFADVTFMQRDPDLTILHNHPHYLRLADRLGQK